MSYFGVEGAIYRALAFLIAGSPCALIIATPTAYLSAISACAKSGVLLKGGITLDALSSCEAIAFDKTGTLTLGELTCTSTHPLSPFSLSEEKALSIALAMEEQVTHPIAKAIVKFCQKKNIQKASIEHFKALPGYGIEAVWEKKKVFIGLPQKVESFLKEDRLSAFRRWKEKAGQEGQLLAVLTIEEEVFLFTFSDQIREEIIPLIQSLRKEHHLDPIMLTGDHKESALTIAKALGIDKVFFELRPEDKLAKVADLSIEKGLAMVGDGINDAPALARANVGISMGKIGSASAVEASDVVLLHDDIGKISWLFSKAKQTQKIVRQNLTLALGVILFATTPALLGLVPLWVAVVLHEGGTVLVGLNSLRLLRKQAGNKHLS